MTRAVARWVARVQHCRLHPHGSLGSKVASRLDNCGLQGSNGLAWDDDSDDHECAYRGDDDLTL